MAPASFALPKLRKVSHCLCFASSHTLGVPSSFVAMLSKRKNASNGEDTQSAPERAEKLEALYHHLENLNSRLDKQAEDFEKRLKEERRNIDYQMRQLREDVASCDERLLLKLESLITESKATTIEAMQNSLDLKMDSVVESLRATTAGADSKVSALLQLSEMWHNLVAWLKGKRWVE
ncbi:unnamed protein product [Gongylonema pulchrum]|uniref:Uncharacterized protein n=1 Tax=Gongylonema pulchrum TaxID=637853 RepID=A0A183D2Y3_9BILA|nr:unnamed protein product [Gongylonema pulchrum]